MSSIQPTPPPLPMKDFDTMPSEQLPRGKIVFYCKSCKALVNADRIGKKYLYKCAICKGSEVALGTEMSIRSVYKIKETKNEDVVKPQTPPTV